MLTTISHRSMATEFAVVLAPSDAHLVEHVVEALERLDQIEANLTIYDPDSEISRVNRNAYESPVTVSEQTYALIQRSLEWSERTAGAFDITAGPLVRAWGFTRRRGRKPTAEEVEKARQSVGSAFVKLTEKSLSVQFSRAGMEINLGAIGKGFALDELAGRLKQAKLANFLIHGGKSSVLACGDQVPASGLGWQVGISHPTKPTVRLAGIRLRDQALSTSGSGQQFFHFRGRRYGHVIDPRTGYPAGDLLSLTAIADNATDAEASSTGYFVLGNQAVAKAHEQEESFPNMIGILGGERNEEAIVVPYGEFDWVDAPAGLGEQSS